MPAPVEAAWPTAFLKAYQNRKERDEYQVLREGIRDLERLLRYQKRACSRRKKAVRTFKAIKLTRPYHWGRLDPTTRLHARTGIAWHCAPFKSFWQSVIIVQDVPMVDGAERLLEVCGAVTSNQLQAFGKINSSLTADAVEALANGFSDCGRQALPCEFGKLLGQTMGLFVFDIHAHKLFLPEKILPPTKPVRPKALTAKADASKTNAAK